MSKLEIHTAIVDGKKIAYTSDTEFLIQVGRGKAAYRTVGKVKGDVFEAIKKYVNVEVLNTQPNAKPHTKKRLIMSGAIKPILAKVIHK